MTDINIILRSTLITDIERQERRMVVFAGLSLPLRRVHTAAELRYGTCTLPLHGCLRLARSQCRSSVLTAICAITLL